MYMLRKNFRIKHSTIIFVILSKFFTVLSSKENTELKAYLKKKFKASVRARCGYAPDCKIL